MSITIKRDVCIGCGKCRMVCPGSLLKADQDRKAYIAYPRDCWGCASCVKECPVNAISQIGRASCRERVLRLV